PGISVPLRVMAGEAEPLSSNVALSSVKNLFGPPLFQLSVVVSQAFAAPSPTHVRLAPPAPLTRSLTRFAVLLVSNAKRYRLCASGPATRKLFWFPINVPALINVYGVTVSSAPATAVRKTSLVPFCVTVPDVETWSFPEAPVFDKSKRSVPGLSVRLPLIFNVPTVPFPPAPRLPPLPWTRLPLILPPPCRELLTVN